MTHEPSCNAPSAHGGRNAPILIVEDDSEEIAHTRRAFRRAGIENPVEVASSANEAMRCLVHSPDSGANVGQRLPVLILLGLLVPGKGGFELLRWIKAQPFLQHLPVIAVSGTGDLSVLSKARELGAVSFMLKPVDPSLLQARLLRLKVFRWRKTATGTRTLDSIQRRSAQLRQLDQTPEAELT